MKQFKTIIATVLVSILISSPILAVQNNGKDNWSDGKPNIEQEEIKVKEEKQEKKAKKLQEKEEKQKRKEEEKEIKETKKLLREELKEKRKQVKVEKDNLKELKDGLEKQYKEAMKNGNMEIADNLNEQILEINAKELELKTQMKNIHGEIKEIVKQNYTYEELEILRELGEKIKEKYDDLLDFPVENIIIDNKDIKFDTPPVIKEGRILIPVRAITRGMKADLVWNQEEQKVAITKDDVEIILYIDKGYALVNGEEVTLDIPASLYNSSTYVPLRFIAENLGLKVDYYEDDNTVIIDDELDEDELDDEEVDDEEVDDEEVDDEE